MEFPIHVILKILPTDGKFVISFSDCTEIEGTLNKGPDNVIWISTMIVHTCMLQERLSFTAYLPGLFHTEQ